MQDNNLKNKGYFFKNEYIVCEEKMFEIVYWCILND